MLRLASFTLALLVTLASAAAQSWTFVQISDPHVGSAAGEPHLHELLQRIADTTPKPRLLVVTGDLTETGQPQQLDTYFDAVRDFEHASGIPVLSLPGNHDVRWNALGRQLVAQRAGTTPNLRIVDDVGFVGLDSTLSFGQHGMLRPRELAQLDELVAAHPDVRDWVLAMHHPPGEGHFLAGENALLSSIDRLPISVVLTGHGHSHRRWQTNGVLLVMAIGAMNRDYGYRWFEVGPDSIVPHAVTIHGKKVTDDAEPPQPRATVAAVSQRAAATAAITVGGDTLTLTSEGPVSLRRGLADGEPVATVPGHGRRRVPVRDLHLDPGVHDLVAHVDGVDVPVTITVPDPSGLALRDLGGTLLTAPLVAGDTVIVASEEGDVTALDPADLTTRWQAQVEPAVWVSPWLAGNEALAIADGTPAVRLLDAEGHVQATQRLPSPVTASAPRRTGGRWLALADGSLWSWTAANGAEHFADLPAMTRAAPLEIADGLLVATWDRCVHRLAADGTEGTSTRLNASFYYSAATADPLPLGDGALFFGHDQRLLQIAADGSLADEHAIDGVQPAYAGGTLTAGGLVLGSLNGAIAVVDPKTFTLRQKVDVGGAVFDSTPLVVGSDAFVGTMNGTLVEADLRRGEVVRRVRLGGYVVADPVRAGDRVIAVSTAGRIASTLAR